MTFWLDFPTKDSASQKRSTYIRDTVIKILAKNHFAYICIRLEYARLRFIVRRWFFFSCYWRVPFFHRHGTFWGDGFFGTRYFRVGVFLFHGFRQGGVILTRKQPISWFSWKPSRIQFVSKEKRIFFLSNVCLPFQMSYILLRKNPRFLLSNYTLTNKWKPSFVYNTSTHKYFRPSPTFTR